MIRTLVVADLTSAATIRQALRHAPSCEVIGWLDSRHAAAELLAQAAPDLVILGRGGNRDGVLGAARHVRRAFPSSKLVLLSAELDAELASAAASAGVDAAISRELPEAIVGMLIREVAAGTIFHFAPSPRTAADAGSVADLLTARELEILRLVAGGLRNGRIAQELWVTEQTVKFHLSNVYRKLGLVNRTEAARFAHLNGLTDALPVAA
jgi:DNA-binding NarL/FixJ family response regulator